MNPADRLLPFRAVDGDTVHIAVQMTDNNIFPRELLQKASQLLHQLISHDDPQPVIDLAEIINIDQHNADNLLFLLGPADIFRQQPYKIIAVIQSGQGVIIGHICQLFVLMLELGNITDTDDLILGYALFIAEHSGTEFQPDPFIPQHTLCHSLLPVLFFQKKHFSEPVHIGFVNHLIKTSQILPFLDFEIEKAVPFSQQMDLAFFKRIIKESIIRGITNQTVHFLLYAQFLIHCCKQIHLISQLVHPLLIPPLFHL